jgi:hypothetical protein
MRWVSMLPRELKGVSLILRSADVLSKTAEGYYYENPSVYGTVPNHGFRGLALGAGTATDTGALLSSSSNQPYLSAPIGSANPSAMVSASPQASTSATSSPQKQSKSIPPPVSSATTPATPSSGGSLKRKNTLDTNNDQPPQKRVTRKRARTNTSNS